MSQAGPSRLARRRALSLALALAFCLFGLAAGKKDAPSAPPAAIPTLETDHMAGGFQPKMDPLHKHGKDSRVGNKRGIPQCDYVCPDPSNAVVLNPTYVPSFNGCGVPGLEIVSAHGFDECCNAHDLCYDECSLGKEGHKNTCDNVFLRCMRKLCDSVKALPDHNPRVYDACMTEANTFKLSVTTFGCGPYTESQKNACLCVPKKDGL